MDKNFTLMLVHQSNKLKLASQVLRIAQAYTKNTLDITVPTSSLNEQLQLHTLRRITVGRLTPSSPRVVMLATLLRVFAVKVQTLRSPVELFVSTLI